MKKIPKWELVLSIVLFAILLGFANSKNPQQHILILTYIGRVTGAIFLVGAIFFGGYVYQKNKRIEIHQKHFILMLVVFGFFIFSFVETINSITSQNRLFFSLSLGLLGLITGVFISKHYFHLQMRKYKPEAPKPARRK